jgi:hypothetical protein
MSIQQLELPTRTGQPRIAPDDHRIDRLVDFLHGKGWTKRNVVAEALGLDDRLMRALKAQSGGLIISNSSKGYRLTLEADAEEVTHAVNELASRIRELEQYRLDVEKVWHSRGKDV